MASAMNLMPKCVLSLTMPLQFKDFTLHFQKLKLRIENTVIPLVSQLERGCRRGEMSLEQTAG
jgi:hypothetical protein